MEGDLKELEAGKETLKWRCLGTSSRQADRDIRAEGVSSEGSHKGSRQDVAGDS